MVHRAQAKENYLVTVLGVSAVLGMAVAVAVYFAWKSHAIAPAWQGPFNALGLFVCPPFILALAINPIPDSDLALALVVGTIIFANAALYAGVASGGYFLVTVFGRQKPHSG